MVSMIEYNCSNYVPGQQCSSAAHTTTSVIDRAPGRLIIDQLTLTITTARAQTVLHTPYAFCVFVSDAYRF